MAQRYSALALLARRACEGDGGLGSSAVVILGAALHAMVEAERTARIRVEPGRRSSARIVQRVAYRLGLLSIPAGNIKLGTPKLRAGSNVCDLLTPRRMIDSSQRRWDFAEPLSRECPRPRSSGTANRRRTAVRRLRVRPESAQEV